MSKGDMKPLDAKYFYGRPPTQESRSITVRLPAEHMDALKEKRVNISAIMRDAVADAVKAVS